MEEMQIIVPVAVKSKLTEALKTTLLNEIGQNISRVEHDMAQLDFEANGKLAEQAKINIQAVAPLRAKYEAQKARMQQVKDHRDNLYYQDPTQSAENQVAVTNAQKVLDNATATAKNTNIVSGGSDEAVALSKQAAQEQVGKMMQEAAVQGAQTKENVWNTTDSQIDQMTNYIATAKKEKALSTAQGITDAAGGLAGAASKLPI